MASENNEIGDIIKKCKILLLDIEGTTTSISFVKDKLFPYAEANVKEFLASQWENESVKEVVAALRKLALEDEEKKTEGVVTIPGEDAGKEEQIEGLVKSVQWQMSSDRKVGPLKQLQGLIWKQGYEKGDIKGHVYDDVSPALKQWLATEGQKVYIYSSGSVQAQKLLFGQSVAGDLMPMIEGYFDTAVGAKQEPASYAAIVEKIGCKPEDVLFLSDIVKEVEAARASGLHAALVSREGNAALPAEAAAAFPVISSFTQLAVSNKRKPEPQEQELPAKVPKTEIEGDVKTASETEVTEPTPAPETTVTTETVAKPVEEPEKMEVEEPTPVESAPQDKVPEKTEEPVHIETSVEEITNSNDAADVAVCEIEPIVEESVEKTEKNETEQMDTDSTESVEKDETVTEPKEPVKDNVETPTIAEESPPNVITVQEVTNDQSEAAEVIDDIVPVVEEPMTVEMEDLQNVGEVLDKECDEILSKVQDVTNLDNIPVKPLLNSIPEETMDAENGENTNDIVESILASEMELAAEKEQEMQNTKPEVLEEKQEVTKVSTVSEKQIETAAENVGESIATETVTEEVKNGETEVATEVTNGDVQATVKEKVEVTADSTSNNEAKPEENNKQNVESETNGSAVDSVENNAEAEVLKPEQKELKEDNTPKPESAETVDSEMQPEESVDKQKEPEKPETSLEKDSKVETENKMESVETPKQEDNKVETNGTDNKVDSKMESESKTEESVPEKVPENSDVKTAETETEKKEVPENKLNGDSNLNGVTKDEELSARLSENGANGKMNGSNGNGNAMEMGQGDNKIEEIPEIKVKTVTEEPRSDPIEQPTEA